MKHLAFILAASATLPLTLAAQDFEDDIYYDGRKAEKTQQAMNLASADTQLWTPTYQVNRDVDEYNRFGGYYESAIDTIGSGMAQSEDFVYTQQIQKFYNPTIVVDNEDVLADVLANSYGNVNIVYGATGPAFASWYCAPYYAAYTPWGGFYSPYNWGWYTGWLDPWYALGPSWYPYWGWGWAPAGWGWGWNAPGWGWHYPGYPGGGYADYHRRPTTGVRPGWSSGARPSNRIPATASRPGSGHYGSASRPVQSGYRGGYSGTRNPSRPGMEGTAVRPGMQPSTTARPGSSTATSPRGNRPETFRYKSDAFNNNGYLNGAGSNNPAVRQGGVAAPRNSTNSTTTYRRQDPSGSNGSSNSYSRPGNSSSSYRQSSGSSGGSRSSGTVRSSGGGGRSSGAGRSSGGGRGGRR